MVKWPDPFWRANPVTRPFFPSLYLVRHATPDWSRTDIPYHLPPGPPLTPVGEREAAQLGEFLRDMGVRRLLHSPLERCARTAALAAAVAGSDLQLDLRLAEIRPEEKSADVLARIWPAWGEAAQACLNGDTLALITHGGPISLLLAELGLSAKDISHYQAKFDRRNPLPPAGAWRALRPTSDGPWSLDLAFTPQAEQKAKAWFV
jgi:broad specificity phosphatase PhoE